MMRLYNSLSRTVEDFSPLDPPNVSIYACGPTVYDYTHIGHARKYIGDDVLKRLLEANNFQVKHVMNITDVGHLVSDADEGEDKMEKGAEQRGQTVWEVAQFFEEYFWKSMDAVNVLRPNVVAKATDHINEQIKLIQKLEEKGFTYQTKEAIYFDVSKFPDYTKLSGQKLEDKAVGVREEVRVDSHKKNPQDFALWFFTVGHFQDHQMRWSAPWGEGFPGWHIECSAMSMEYLGDTIDIHTGGKDHVTVHHTNEIAQSESATGKQFVRFWVHHNFLQVDREKMSKSKGNFYTVDNVIEKGFDPLSLRYLFLTAHYRDELNFTWDSLQAAHNALNNLRAEIRSWSISNETAHSDSFQKFMDALNNDLNTPQAIAVVWEMMKSDLSNEEKSATLLKMDKVLGLGLDQFVGKQVHVPEDVQALVEEREKARANKDFKKSDELRDKIKELGFEVEDTLTGPRIT